MNAEMIVTKEKLEIPWDYTHLDDCPKCQSNDLEITELEHPKHGFFCAEILCNECNYIVEATYKEPADTIWNENHRPSIVL